LLCLRLIYLIKQLSFFIL